MPYVNFFRVVPSFEYVKQLIESICIRDKNDYILTNECFKRIKILGKLSNIQAELSEFYALSKQSYINKMTSYIGFSNVFRQLCKYHNIRVISHIVYIHSTYQIEYKIQLHSD